MPPSNRPNMKFNEGDEVHVSGEVKWGDSYYRVSTPGVITQWKKGAYALVTLEQVDGDHNVCIHVPKMIIAKRTPITTP